MDEKLLEKFGLTKNESKVYLTLLRLGKANSAELARESGVHRINVYDVINSLIAKGLVSYIVEGNVRVFKPETPLHLKETLSEKMSSLEEALPELLKSFEGKKGEVDISILRGVEGKRTHLMEVMRLAKNETNRLFLLHGFATAEKPPYTTILPKYFKQLKENKVITKVLVPDAPEVRQRAKIYGKLTNNIPIIKFSKKISISPITWNIVGDFVYITLQIEPSLTIRIKSKEIAKSFRNNFDVLWKVAG